jgi:hypothetical protein
MWHRCLRPLVNKTQPFKLKKFPTQIAAFQLSDNEVFLQYISNHKKSRKRIQSGCALSHGRGKVLYLLCLPPSLRTLQGPAITLWHTLSPSSFLNLLRYCSQYLRFSIEKVGQDSPVGHGMAVIAFLVVSNDAYQFLWIETKEAVLTEKLRNWATDGMDPCVHDPNSRYCSTWASTCYTVGRSAKWNLPALKLAEGGSSNYKKVSPKI